ncbi:MAG: NACHT domain-containing protein, partial [Anaerolineae bacterium]
MESPAVADGISEGAVRDVLSAVRYARSVDSPLAGLAVVGAWMRQSGVAPTAENAAWSLASLLQDLVASELARLRVRAGPRAADPPGSGRRGLALLSADQERTLLVADFQSGNPELEAWSALNVRFLSPAGLRMADVPDLVGTSRATLARRLNEGLTRLTDLLREREGAACRQMAHRPGVPVVDRIVVSDGGDEAGGEPSRPGQDSGSDTVTLAARLLAAARDDNRVVRLSARECSRLARLPVTDLTTYRLARIAEWSRPQYRLDERFVDLTLLVDRGEDADCERWQAQPERLGSLRELLAEVPDPAFVVLGSPGAGKSTMLRRLELDLAVAGLREATRAVPFMVHLGTHRPPRSGGERPSPQEWLADQWTKRYPGLPSLESLLDIGGVVLLLDALNEIPRRDMAEYRDRLMGWRGFAQTVAASGRGNRVVFTCRSLEYSAPLSSPGLRVPQVRLEPLSDSQVADFLRAYSPGRADELWGRLRENPRLDLVRTPYFLKLLVQLMTADDEVPQGRAALFTGFVRQAVGREIRRDNPLFLPDRLLSDRDYRRVLGARRWKTPWELPSRGPLFPALSHLAWRMQRGEPLAEAAQVRVDYDTALGILRDGSGGGPSPGGGRHHGGNGAGGPGDPRPRADPEDIIRAGVALGVLDEDVDRDHVLFFHQLLQEYFAGRHAATDPRPAVARVAWRGDAQVPSLAEVLESLGPAETLPALPRSNWEETTLMAAEMAADPAEFVKALAGENLPLAGWAAVQPVVRAALPPETVAGL